MPQYRFVEVNDGYICRVDQKNVNATIKMSWGDYLRISAVLGWYFAGAVPATEIPGEAGFTMIFARRLNVKPLY